MQADFSLRFLRAREAFQGPAAAQGAEVVGRKKMLAGSIVPRGGATLSPTAMLDAFSDPRGAGRRHIGETTMQTQFITQRRSITDQLADRIVADPAFLRAMEQDPDTALADAGYYDDLLAPGIAGPEVLRAQPCPYSCWNTTCTSMFSTGKWA